MSLTRKKKISIVYNGTEIWQDLSPYLEKITLDDSVDESDKISMGISDRDLKWTSVWILQKGDTISFSITLENWNYEGERITFFCGSFVIDDFSFSAPPLRGNINGVSAPVNTNFKETQNTKTWESATVQLIAAEIAKKYGLSLVYEAIDIPIEKMEQNKQVDSEFLKNLCKKYGLGIKVYSDRLVIWSFKDYFAQEPVITLYPNMVSKWSYKSTMQGTYTGAKVSYTNPATKKTIEVVIGTEERLCKITQKADSEADARLIGESTIRDANRKETTMQITMPPMMLVATQNIRLSGFGVMDGIYFIEKVSHSISRKAYNMQLYLSRISESKEKE